MQRLSMGIIIALAATGIFLSIVTAGLIATQIVPSDGTVAAINVSVYSDSECTQNCTSVSWEILYPGNSTSRMIYVKNNGTVPVTLTMATGSWMPTTANSVSMRRLRVAASSKPSVSAAVFPVESKTSSSSTFFYATHFFERADSTSAKSNCISVSLAASFS